MSQGIMERNLPVADSIGEGDKVRIVTSAGNSKNIDASQIGGNTFPIHVTVTVDPSDESITSMACDITVQEVSAKLNGGKMPYLAILQISGNDEYVTVYNDLYVEIMGNNAMTIFASTIDIDSNKIRIITDMLEFHETQPQSNQWKQWDTLIDPLNTTTLFPSGE